MSLRFAKRAASSILNRGITSIRIKSRSVADAEKALTKEDIRRLVSSGGIYAVKAKHNLSLNSKMLKKAREEGRRRGVGRRRGSANARKGRAWEKKVRSQRKLLKKLKEMKKVDNATFNRFYQLIKGNIYSTKSTLLSHLKEEGMNLSDDELKGINEAIRKEYA